MVEFHFKFQVNAATDSAAIVASTSYVVFEHLPSWEKSPKVLGPIFRASSIFVEYQKREHTGPNCFASLAFEHCKGTQKQR